MNNNRKGSTVSCNHTKRHKRHENQPSKLASLKNINPESKKKNKPIIPIEMQTPNGRKIKEIQKAQHAKKPKPNQENKNPKASINPNSHFNKPHHHHNTPSSLYKAPN